MRKDYGWGDEVVIQIPSPEESITTHVEGFLSVFTYPFTLGPLDPVVIDFCKTYEVTLGQIHPSFWRIVIMLRFFSEKAEGLEFTLSHLIKLYRPHLFRGLIKLQRGTTKAIFASTDETKDRGWMSRFVRVRTSDIIPGDKMPFPESHCLGAPRSARPRGLGTKKLAATSSYDERKWHELAKGQWEAKNHGLRDASEMRPAPPGEKTKPSIPKLEKDNKRKRVSKPEDPQEKKTPTRRLQKRFAQAGADSAPCSPGDEENDDEESALGTPKKDAGKAPVSPEVEIVPLSSTTIPEGANAETPEANENAPSEELGAAKTGHSLSFPTYSEGAIEEANALRMPDPSEVLEEDPFQGCYAGIEDANDLNDASTIFEEAQHLLSRAIVKFRAEVSQCEAELKKVSGEEKALRLLCSQKEEELKDLRTALTKAQKSKSGLDEQQNLEMIGKLRSEVDQVKAGCHQWKKSMDQLDVDKEAVTAQLASAETQLRSIKAKGLSQAKKIEELEAELARPQVETVQAKAEVVQVKAEAEKTKAAADKSIAMYLRDVMAVQAELREASDWGKRSNDLAKCQARRETLKEIHAQGFNLAEEIAEAKARETDARFLVSSDDEDVASGSGDGESEEDVPEGEEAPEDRATEGAVSEDDASRGVTPKID
ncbi:PREDICTED: uncharacterized protein LOC109226169 [Nicotiana attenuata]|uniref:uncharacterized protein LOC109226169 n=1 Tax=Nicotiana attenuata TaxID=49451 RepID=UPI0009048502|nr:PREDICTED: uncharacterized protein LOC109226169 [Nicotiana attenuata]